jgi:drug/metabolite transporter (DMT)-like permease
MDRASAGWGSGLLGVIIFSGSLPATRVAVADFSPMFLTSLRAVIAAVLGVAFLLLLRQVKPARGDIIPLAIVALGVVVGFPLLTALALQHITAAHSIVFIGLLPLATAIFGVLRGGERPNPAFWLFSILGAGTVAGFAHMRSDGGSVVGDLLMVAAIVLCGLGYAEGAALSRRLGGWQVISWALLLALPMIGGDSPVHAAIKLERRWCARVDQPGLRVDLQHADRIPLLVSRPGPRWHRRRRSVAALAALLRADAGGSTAP